MTATPAWHVQPATADQLGPLAVVLGRAMVNEPMMRWPIGDVPDPERAIEACSHIWEPANLDLGVVYTTAAGAGVAIWVAPEQASQWSAAERQARPAVHAHSDDGGERYEQMWDWVESLESAEPGWYLDRVAVDPDRQGEGIGRALIRFGLDRAAAAGTPAFLDTGTERNVGLYESLGFRVVDDGNAPNGGPRIWFLRWDPSG